MAMLAVDHFPLFICSGHSALLLCSWAAVRRETEPGEPGPCLFLIFLIFPPRLWPCRNFSPQGDSKQLGRRWSGATPASSVRD